MIQYLYCEVITVRLGNICHYTVTEFLCMWWELLKSILATSLIAQLVKNPPAMWETWVWSLGWEDPLEKGKATLFSILAWRISWGRKELDTTEWLSLSNFQICNTVLLTVVSMLFTAFSDLPILYLEVCTFWPPSPTFWPLSPISSPVPTPCTYNSGNQQSVFFFYELGCVCVF